MNLDIHIGSESYSVETARPIDISIPVRFNEKQPNAFDVPHAKSDPVRGNNFVGDTREGGSCNFEAYTIIPHCNGTHTECVGHIAYERISLNEILRDAFLPATVLTVQPVKSNKTNDTYIPEKDDEDFLITRESLKRSLEGTGAGFHKALVVRTLPNDDSKMTRRYMAKPPPFFSLEAMEFLITLNIEHLLVDIPSIDRPLDQGKMTTHHLYWSVPLESHEVEATNHSLKTITEMVYIPENIPDGHYFMNIQIPNFVADASPSRVLLYRIEFEK